MLIHRRRFVEGFGAAAFAATLFSPRLAAAETASVTLSDGASAPRLGLGSWHMADPGSAPEEQAEDAMRLGLSLGLTLIDTAELYGGGRAEEMVAKVVAGRRNEVFLVSKVMPDHASEDGIAKALRASLHRLGTDHLDLYLLHWRKPRRWRMLDTVLFREGDLKSAVNGFERARREGLIRHWGVSNFSVSDMEELFSIPGGDRCAANQVLYNLHDRAIETDLVPWCDKHKVAIMAYSPLGAGGRATLLADPALKTIADARGVGPATIALAWAMRNGRTMVVTETASAKHVREDAAALTLALSQAELSALDQAFPAPRAS